MVRGTFLKHLTKLAGVDKAPASLPTNMKTAEELLAELDKQTQWVIRYIELEKGDERIGIMGFDCWRLEKLKTHLALGFTPVGIFWVRTSNDDRVADAAVMEQDQDSLDAALRLGARLNELRERTKLGLPSEASWWTNPSR